MKIVNKPPPKHIMTRANKEFGVTFETTTFVYGDTIHTIDPNPIKHLIVHETVRVKQQAEMGAEEWWEQFFADPKFRLEQEIPAYQKQFQYIRSSNPNREVQTKALWQLAVDLSGEMYGGIINHSEAMKLIRNKK